MIRAGTIGRVPTWTPDPARFPRFALLDGPSPLAPLARLSAVLGGRAELWIKREDLLPLAFGGNKLRNLEYLVGAALAEGADTLVTSGRRWSNHARLTAAAGARAGLEVHLVLSGPPADPPNPGVVLGELLGATVHHAVTEARAERAALVDRVMADLRSAGRRPYLVAVGGSDVVGAVGQVMAGLELADGAAQRGFVPDDVVVPSATGGTQAGLVMGLRAAGARTVVQGIAVTPRDELHARIVAMVDALGALDGLGRLRPVANDAIRLDGDQLGAGYGRPTAAADAAGRLLARTEGILVDPIYTAKALAGLIDRVRSGAFDGHRVVFWHAGGTTGIFEPLAGSEG
jgi:1-aminocyclopropane-1-carboxylate deaminase/D-cysteine desulfhydrase-like pyridoxal-dependent ACC family enzyme